MGGSAVRPSVSLADLKAGPASSDAGSAPWRRDALARRGDERSAMSPASSSSSAAALLPPRPDIIDPGAPVTVRPKSWMDRVMDTVIGDTDGPNNRYALICSQCHTHNGLALPQDFLTLSFRCHHCGMLNANRHAHASVAGRTAGTLATSRSYDVLRSPVGYSPSFPLLPQGTPGHPTFQKPSASFGGRGQREVWHDDAGDAGSGGDDDGSGEGDGHSSRGNGDDNDDGNDVGDPSRERSRAAAEASDASDTSDTEEPRAAAAARAASTPGRMLRRRHNLGVRTEPRLRQRSNEDDAGPDSHCNHGAPPSRSQRPGAAAVNRSEARPEADPAEGHAEVHANDHHASATTASKRVTRRTSSRLAAARSAPPASASSARLAAPADHD
ncbi:hypothetical protein CAUPRSCDRAFT_11920 [Caulochytrium protostelioides]|uniref:Endoplasmic reticulum junction formation protein lunapark n=1 Tax=Caulochytrium protostelioides TaxID=1555241 RepID=A0A4P9WY29_9FUNG|nr:hypothetical protein CAUPRSCDRAFT_11920 [Caulochytrium protostelioides]